MLYLRIVHSVLLATLKKSTKVTQTLMIQTLLVGADLYDDVLTNIKDEQKPNPGVDRGQSLEKIQGSSSLHYSSLC